MSLVIFLSWLKDFQMESPTTPLWNSELLKSSIQSWRQPYWEAAVWVLWLHQRERGQILVPVLASDEVTPYSGLKPRHLPLPARAGGGRAGASYPPPASFLAHVEELWLSWCQPHRLTSPIQSTYPAIHIHYILHWNDWTLGVPIFNLKIWPAFRGWRQVLEPSWWTQLHHQLLPSPLIWRLTLTSLSERRIRWHINNVIIEIEMKLVIHPILRPTTSALCVKSLWKKRSCSPTSLKATLPKIYRWSSRWNSWQQ